MSNRRETIRGGVLTERRRYAKLSIGMAEGNGFVTGDARVDAALKRMQERNDARFQALEDALLVQVHLEKRMGELIRNQAEYLANHEERLATHEKSIAEYEQRMKRIEINVAEIAEKANFLFDREMRREGGPETRG